nr:MAG: hypothetical protein [Bacteriophage sp.]
MLQQHVAAVKKSSSEYGKVLEWLKRHAWKACNRQNRFGGSNPPLSAYNQFISPLFIAFLVC